METEMAMEIGGCRKYRPSSNGTAVPCMQDGTDPAASYASNSRLQYHNFHSYAKPHLADALHRFIGLLKRSRSSCSSSYRTVQEEEEEEGDGYHQYGAASISNHNHQHHHSPQLVSVADFGCSYGQNTLAYANFIINTLAEGLSRPLDNNPDHAASEGRKIDSHDQGDIEDGGTRPVEIQYFFSDLPSNDFNHLFQSLQHELGFHDQPQPDGKSNASRLIHAKVYAAGVPGSFYDRLFPAESLDFVMSAYSLHWISHIPPEVLDKSSPAWNGGHVWIHGERPQVAEAYARQSKADLIRFLKCRAEEMACNGILFLFCLTRTQELPIGYYLNHHNDSWCGYFESTWNEMVEEGVISQEERDTFNIPHYNFHYKELEAALKEVPTLKIVKLEVMGDQENLPEEETHSLLKDPQAFGKFWAGFLGSLPKPMMQAHIGLERTTNFFQRLERNATKNANFTTHLTYDLLIAICQRS